MPIAPDPVSAYPVARPTVDGTTASTTSIASVEGEIEPAATGRASLRIIGAWEAVKGVLVLLAAGLAATFLRPTDERTVEDIVSHFHLNPAGHTSHIFQRALENLADTRVVLLAGGALLYALLRFVEAYGLWFQKRWGWVLGIASAALYLPLEIREMTHRFTWLGAALFAVNVVIVVLLWRNRTRHVVAA